MGNQWQAFHFKSQILTSELSYHTLQITLILLAGASTLLVLFAR